MDTALSPCNFAAKAPKFAPMTARVIHIVTFVALYVTTLGLPSPSYACPTIEGLVDFNCDGEISILLSGDSITYGIGDDRPLSDSDGGYPARLQEMLPFARIEKLAKPGATVGTLRRYLHTRTWREVLHHNFDYAIVLIGVNNFWEHSTSKEIVHELHRIEHYLEGFGTLVSVATLIPTNRSFQSPFVENLNARIERTYTDYVDFNSISSEHLNSDGLHPNAKGYREMAHVAREFIDGRLQEIARLYSPPTEP